MFSIIGHDEYFHLCRASCFPKRVHTDIVSVVLQVDGLVGVLLPRLRLRGVRELLDVMQSPLRKRSLGSYLHLLEQRLSLPRFLCPSLTQQGSVPVPILCGSLVNTD